MKKRSEVTQTPRADCSKADPQTNTQTGAITIHTAQLSTQCNYTTDKALALNFLGATLLYSTVYM